MVKRSVGATYGSRVILFRRHLSRGYLKNIPGGEDSIPGKKTSPYFKTPKQGYLGENPAKKKIIFFWKPGQYVIHL